MASSGATLRIDGIRDLTRAVREAEGELDVFLHDGMMEIAEHVAADVRQVYRGYSAKGAAGVKAKVPKSGSALVAQSLSKSRQQQRRRPNFGGLMMREAFMPGLERNESFVLGRGEELLRELEARW